MTIQTKFHNWQSDPRDPIPPPFHRAQPAVVSINNYLTQQGMPTLGMHFDRKIGSSNRWSTHAFGTAGDNSWRQSSRENCLEQIDFLIANSKELGVQAVHDYWPPGGGRIWRPPGTSGRPLNSDGWKAGGAKPRNDHIHFEVHPDDMNDGRSVEEKINTTPEEDVIALPNHPRHYDSRAGGNKLHPTAPNQNFSFGPITEVPVGAKAAFICFTTTDSDGAGWLSLFDTDSNFHSFASGRNVSGMALIPLNADRTFKVSVGGSATHLIIDIQGYTV